METDWLNPPNEEVGKVKVKAVGVSLVLLVFLTGCAQTTSEPSAKSGASSMKSPINPMDVGPILSRAQNRLNESRVTTAAAFDGKTNIKFRLMVHDYLSLNEADRLFREVLQVIQDESPEKNMWGYYNAHFDIDSYEHGVIYVANKKADSQLKVNRSGSIPIKGVEVGTIVTHDAIYIRTKKPLSSFHLPSSAISYYRGSIQRQDKDLSSKSGIEAIVRPYGLFVRSDLLKNKHE